MKIFNLSHHDGQTYALEVSVWVWVCVCVCVCVCMKDNTLDLLVQKEQSVWVKAFKVQSSSSKALFVQPAMTLPYLTSPTRLVRSMS